MLELRNVGLVLRDQEQDFPLAELHEVFDKQEIGMVRLEQADPLPADVDLVMAMGGDGTVLKALDSYPECPVLAINFGTVGFLTAGDQSDLKRIVSLLVDGRYVVSERLVLECVYPGGARRAINEVIVRVHSHLLFADVYVGDTKIRTIIGDGIVVGTPTGSTAFLLSTGAPLVMPDVRCMILDGINEYNFSSRALILPPESRVRLQISSQTRDPQVYLTMDGHQMGTLSAGEEIHITESSRTAKLVYLEPDYFFHNLSSKLDW